MRFYPHGTHVVRAADGRAGAVKDIEGPYCNITWDDGGPREWIHVDELRPAEPPPG